MYVDLQQVAGVLSFRQKDQKLLIEVEKFWKSLGVVFPEEISGKAFLGRALDVPRLETIRFLSLAKKADLEPIVGTYVADKFVTSAPNKLRMVIPKEITSVSKKGFPIIKKVKLVKNINRYDGKRISELPEEMFNYHKSRMKYLENLGLEVRDFSGLFEVFKANNLYYQGYLSMFIVHAVLFEDYHGQGETPTGRLSSFTEDVFEPAFEALRARFGVKPIITPLPWGKNDDLIPPEESFKKGLGDELIRKLLNEEVWYHTSLIINSVRIDVFVEKIKKFGFFIKIS